jgi:hypothetical protein
MEKITIDNNVSLWGFQVKSFPQGISEAFDSLMTMIPDGLDREYYGYSLMDGDEICYYAMAVELVPGEAERYNASRKTIEKGEYLAVKVKGWKEKTHTINDIFHEMMQGRGADPESPAVERYIDDEEMVCMIKLSQNVVAGK